MAKWRAEHVEQRKATLRAWKQRNPEKVRANKHAYDKSPSKRASDGRQYRKNPDVYWARNLKSKYGLTVDQYNAMFTAQGGKCIICGEPERPGKRLGVEHDHATNRVRGLACERCNRAIGLVQESSVTLRAAADYLDNARV
jgi:hypothetical protein